MTRCLPLLLAALLGCSTVSPSEPAPPPVQPAPLPIPAPSPEPLDPPAVDALAEVNAARAKRGLRPFLRDDLLTLGAMRLASYRAAHRIEGHLKSDFSLLPEGANARATGCAAWPPEDGWGACETYSREYTRAGAAWAMGKDGRLRFMHLVLR